MVKEKEASKKKATLLKDESGFNKESDVEEELEKEAEKKAGRL